MLHFHEGVNKPISKLILFCRYIEVYGVDNIVICTQIVTIYI